MASRPPPKPKTTDKDKPLVIRDVSGSCAGAGSGDFHYYRGLRRTEMERLKKMDKDYEEEKESREYEERQSKRTAEDDDKTQKRRAKRQRKKQAMMHAKIRRKMEQDLEESQQKASSSSSDTQSQAADAKHCTKTPTDKQAQDNESSAVCQSDAKLLLSNNKKDT